MAARDRIIVGLDIGTTKICCIITELRETGDLEVIGFGISESKGLRRGLVVNMEQTVEAIGNAVEDAEKMAGIRVDEVYTGIAGGHIQGILWPRHDEEKQKGADHGLRTDGYVYEADELVTGQNTIFVATGVTDGQLVAGVRHEGDFIYSESVVLRG
ncbi:MAG TPA: fructose-bisphosphatase class II, partial [Deltaproteobacteria bacterium]|nr:fructose-bisphosphatase class II [Deltaproteobacteria bacterium]